MNRSTPLLALAAMLAAGNSQAADLGVLTSLDVCDSLGASGLTLSSATNCLKVSGSVYYEFSSGNYAVRLPVLSPLAYTQDPADDQVTVIDDQGTPDWYSYAEAYLRFEAAADSDFGPARAVVELYGYQEHEAVDGIATINDDADVAVDYAYVSVGDQTVISVGLQDSIINLEDDVPYDWLGTFNSNLVGDGVAFDNAAGGTYDTEGHSIQLVSDLGNGWKAGAGLEALDSSGSAVGFVSYGPDAGPLGGHVSVVAGDLFGDAQDWAVHAGVTAQMELAKASAAIALNDTGWWNAIFTGAATFDIFTLAGTVDGTSEDELDASGSLAASVNDSVTLTVGGRWADSDTTLTDDELFELRGRIEYEVAEALTLGAELGNLWNGANAPNGDQSIADIAGDLTWSPLDSGYTATLKGQVNTLGGYKATFTAEKAIE